MDKQLNFPINENGPISQEVRNYSFTDFHVLAEFIRNIPYGRPSNVLDVLSVLKENSGTCSSKHRLLAAVAHECGHPEVELMVGIYKMSEANTPGVGFILEKASVASVHEAHC